jgi:hypothetical protein
VSKLDDQIAKLGIEKLHSQRLQNYIKVLNKNIDDTQKEIELLKDKYIDEIEDVERLEDKSLSNVFRKVLGPGEEALKKEKQEILWAYMSLEKAQRSLELLKYEKSVLIRQLIGLEYDEEKYKALLKQKEEMLKQYPQLRIKLTLIDHKLTTLMNEDKEIREVMDVIKDLKDLFSQLGRELDEITNWNQAQRKFYGKGHYSSYHKKQFVKRNRDLVPRIELLNDKLKMELKDLKENHEINLTYNLTMLNNFFVLFLDNLITDWVVRGGISSTKKTVELSLNKLYMLDKMLNHELTSIGNELKKLNAQRLEVIIKESGDDQGLKKPK